jgi:hypothetical protein
MLQLQADAVPNTLVYMIAGYAVIFIILALYLLSLLVRSRSAKRDMAMLEEIREKEETKLTPELN